MTSYLRLVKLFVLIIQLLDLQLKIEGLTATYNNEKVTLEDICFKPLAPDNNKCTTESVLEYWQKNHTNIDKVVMDSSGFYVKGDYLDHFQFCVRYVESIHILLRCTTLCGLEIPCEL
jgi:hypothetical protein